MNGLTYQHRRSEVMAGEILGGEDRIDTTLFESCGDSLIVNLGTDEESKASKLPIQPGNLQMFHVQEDIDPKKLGNWHM